MKVSELFESTPTPDEMAFRVWCFFRSQLGNYDFMPGVRERVKRELGDDLLYCGHNDEDSIWTDLYDYGGTDTYHAFRKSGRFIDGIQHGKIGYIRAIAVEEEDSGLPLFIVAKKDVPSPKNLPKDVVIRGLLGIYHKHHGWTDGKIIFKLIERLRALGVNYPEFESIERSAGSRSLPLKKEEK